MNLYHIQDEGESFWVEAESFSAAISLWGAWMIEAYGAYEGEPDSVHLVHGSAVIRKVP